MNMWTKFGILALIEQAGLGAAARNGSLQPSTTGPRTVAPPARYDQAALLARVQELERLCADVYVEAVELGLPQPMLNRLWTVGANGAAPVAFDLQAPDRLGAPADPVQAPASADSSLPDVRLIDRGPASRRQQWEETSRPELKPIARRRTVMVVDDDPTILEVLVRILQRENYELLVACNGPQAMLRAARYEGVIDLLITDYSMPQMHGRQLAVRMRERYPHIAVLYQTGFSDMLFENRKELEQGATFLEKPFTARGLCEAARLALFESLNGPVS
jgi:CheY-like chemotaxis protein